MPDTEDEEYSQKFEPSYQHLVEDKFYTEKQQKHNINSMPINYCSY